MESLLLDDERKADVLRAPGSIAKGYTVDEDIRAACWKVGLLEYAACLTMVNHFDHWQLCQRGNAIQSEMRRQTTFVTLIVYVSYRLSHSESMSYGRVKP